jgi:hypothetical protein
VHSCTGHGGREGDEFRRLPKKSSVAVHPTGRPRLSASAR